MLVIIFNKLQHQFFKENILHMCDLVIGDSL